MRLMPMNPAARSWLGRLPARLYVVALVLLGVLLAGYFLFVQPKNKAMAEMRQSINDRKASLQVLEVEMAKLAGSRQRVTQLQKAITGFEERLPRQGEIDVILREVWVIADAAGLKTQSIKTQKGRQQDTYKVLPIEVRLQGDFIGLYKFLLSLEKLPGVMNVESLKLQMAPAEGSELVDIGLVLHVYCRG